MYAGLPEGLDVAPSRDSRGRDRTRARGARRRRPHGRAESLDRHFDDHIAGLGELDGIAHQIHQHLPQPAWITDHAVRDIRPDVTRQLQLLFMRPRCKQLDRSFDGVAEGLTRDDVLDNITLYWLTNTGISAARSYWDNKPPYFGPKKFFIPAAVTVFPGEIYQPSRRWAERGYSNLSYFHEVDKGGHFAAWEEPLLFASEMRAAFKSLR